MRPHLLRWFRRGARKMLMGLHELSSRIMRGNSRQKHAQRRFDTVFRDGIDPAKTFLEIR
jgi:hypothetical protein